MQKICFLSVDVESDFAQGKSFTGVEKLNNILGIFKRVGVKATLFVSGAVLQRFSKQAKDWANDFEIASHSQSHIFWNKLDKEQRQKDIAEYFLLFQNIFRRMPAGFRAPSHIIDNQSLQVLQDSGFLYDSSVVPAYPIFKKYRGYQGKAPKIPYFPSQKDYKQKGDMPILEIPVSGQMFGLPLAGAYISRLPHFIYRSLFLFYKPKFIAVSIHPWDAIDFPRIKTLPEQFLQNLEKLLLLLKKQGYIFLTGIDIYEQFSKSRQ